MLVQLNEEQIAHVFDEFYKADESRHDFESSGLGMPICKRIIEKHGGRIWAESEGLGKGSTVHFSLPYAASEKKTTFENQVSFDHETILNSMISTSSN